MGKNKNKGKKDTSVFKVAGVRALKAKNKPKAVTTNLKKMNFQNKSKTDKANETLAVVREALKNGAKGSHEKRDRSKDTWSAGEPAQAVDMNEAAEEFAKL